MLFRFEKLIRNRRAYSWISLTPRGKRVSCVQRMLGDYSWLEVKNQLILFQQYGLEPWDVMGHLVQLFEQTVKAIRPHVEYIATDCYLHVLLVEDVMQGGQGNERSAPDHPSSGQFACTRS